MSKILSVEDISVAFDGKLVLNSVSLDVLSSDFIGIIGPNGGGKTTLIKSILGLVKPIKGQIIKHKECHFGYLPQISVVDREFPITISEIVLSGLQHKKGIFGRYTREDLTSVERIMDECGILSLKDKAPCEVSGGELQRALLCRAVISEPSLLLLDEPTTYVDDRFGREIFSWLEELNRKMAIVMVSHDLSLIARYAKSIACVNRNIHFHKTDQVTELLYAMYGGENHPCSSNCRE